jgi:paraquat-inducible protein B
MTDVPPQRTKAVARHSRWPGIIWAIPLAALLIVGYLGLRAFAQRGIDVVITFPSGDGLKVGDTKVIYRGVEAGHVTDIELADDAHSVDVTVRFDPRVKNDLVSSTTFWLIGAKPELTDLASVKAALAGVIIGMAPGSTGPQTRHFQGLAEPPIVMPGTQGTRYTLDGDRLGSIRPGSDVLYRGLEVGKVTSFALVDRTNVRVGIFVQAPYDQLVRPDTMFWSASPLQISLSGQGLTTQIQPSAVLSGGVEFDTQPENEGEPQAGGGTTYTLYADKSQALAGGNGPQLLYQVHFGASAGDLEAGAPVKLGGYRIGSVKLVRMSVDGRTGIILADATIGIQPQRLNLTGIAKPADGNWRPAVDATLNALLAQGYRAGLSQSPPLIGSSYVAIDRDKAAGPATLAGDPGQPLLPTRADRDFGAITDKLGSIVDKLDNVPIAAIGENVRQITANLNKLTGSPEIADSIKHLDSTLDQVDRMMREVRPQIGPLFAHLNQAADQLEKTATSANRVIGGQGASQDAGLPQAIQELTEAARSIRSLTDYLGRHPEALLLGKSRQGS